MALAYPGPSRIPSTKVIHLFCGALPYCPLYLQHSHTPSHPTEHSRPLARRSPASANRRSYRKAAASARRDEKGFSSDPSTSKTQPMTQKTTPITPEHTPTHPTVENSRAVPDRAPGTKNKTVCRMRRSKRISSLRPRCQRSESLVASARVSGPLANVELALARLSPCTDPRVRSRTAGLSMG